MSKQVQLRRGNTAVSGTFTGAQGELVVDTQANVLVLHDGFTQGGHTVASVAYVDAKAFGNTGNISLSGNTISTTQTNENLYITPNGAGIVVIPSLDVINPIVANISGSATYATTAGSTTSAVTAGTAIEVTGNAQPAITSVGTLINLTVTSPIIGNISGSALTATISETVTANAQPNITSVGTLSGLTVTNPIVGNISGSASYATAAAEAGFAVSASTANNAAYLGSVPAADYVQTSATIAQANNSAYLGNIPASDYVQTTSTIAQANNASYLGGVPAAGYQLAGTYVTPTTLDNSTLPASFTTLHTSGDATVTGNLTVVGNVIANITSVNNAIVYNAGTNQTIYTGNIQLNGTSGITVTLPAAYSNTHYRVQISYNANTINIGSFGWIYSSVINSSQFTIHSTTTADYNSVFWTTFGSNIA